MNEDEWRKLAGENSHHNFGQGYENVVAAIIRFLQRHPDLYAETDGGIDSAERVYYAMDVPNWLKGFGVISFIDAYQDARVKMRRLQ